MGMCRNAKNCGMYDPNSRTCTQDQGVWYSKLAEQPPGCYGGSERIKEVKKEEGKLENTVK